MRRRYATLLAIAGLATMLVVSVYWAQSPVAVTHTSSAVAPAYAALRTSIPEPVPSKSQTIDTKYFSLSLPDNFQMRTRTETQTAAIVGRYVLNDTQPGVSDQVALTVGILGNNSVDELSSVKLRQATPADYQPRAITGAPAGAIGFSKRESYETSLFWRQDNYYVMLVVGGQPQRAKYLDDTLAMVLEGWKWH